MTPDIEKQYGMLRGSLNVYEIVDPSLDKNTLTIIGHGYRTPMMVSKNNFKELPKTLMAHIVSSTTNTMLSVEETKCGYKLDSNKKTTENHKG